MKVAGNVLADDGATAFGVAHFPQNVTAGAGDALDGVDGAVGVKLWVHGGFATKVGVLRGNLTDFGEGADVLFGSVELSFAMGEGDVVEIADLTACEPWGEVR